MLPSSSTYCPSIFSFYLFYLLMNVLFDLLLGTEPLIQPSLGRHWLSLLG